MKLQLVLAFLLLGLSASVWAAPIIIKSNHGGMTPRDYIYSERCEVHMDHVLIKRQYGASDTKTEFEQRVEVKLTSDFEALYLLAEKEKVQETRNGMCDGPGTTVYANNKEGKFLGLFSSGGCGQPRRLRRGPISERLRAIIDGHCPKTFDPQAP